MPKWPKHPATLQFLSANICYKELDEWMYLTNLPGGSIYESHFIWIEHHSCCPTQTWSNDKKQYATTKSRCCPSFHDPLLGARTGVRLPRRMSGAGAGGDPDAFRSARSIRSSARTCLPELNRIKQNWTGPGLGESTGHVCGEGSIAKRSSQVDVEPIDLSSYSEITVYNLPRLLFWLAIVGTIWIHLEFCLFLCTSLYHLFLWVLHSWFWSRPWGFEVQTPVLGQSRNGCPLACADCATAQPALLCVRRCPASKSNRWTRIGKATKNDRKTAFFIWIYILLWLHKAPGTIASSLRASVGSSFLTELLLTWAFRLYLPSRNINDIKGSKCLGSSYKILWIRFRLFFEVCTNFGEFQSGSPSLTSGPPDLPSGSTSVRSNIVQKNCQVLWNSL